MANIAQSLKGDWGHITMADPMGIQVVPRYK